MSNLMENDVYNAAVNGDLTIFSIKNHDQLLKKTYKNNNIIHVAAQHQQLHFIKAALNNFPTTPTSESLICDQNRHGNTPVHIAAEFRDEAVIDQLYKFFSTQCGSDRVFPWRVTNEDGNTPAHIALLCGNTSVAMYLVDKDEHVARLLNRSNETLLHLAIQYHVFENFEAQITETQATSSSEKVYQPPQNLRPIVELLLKIDSSITCWADADGSTPLHKAASLEPAYCVRVIKAMLSSCSEAAEVQDDESGNTILHLLTNHQVASYEQGQELLSIPHVRALKNSKNKERDTPLHLAARNRDTIMVRVLLESSPNLGLKNKSGVSAGSLVRQLDEMKFTETPIEEIRKLSREEREAAILGNVAFLKEKIVSEGMNFLVSQSVSGGNVLHLVMQCDFEGDTINEIEEFIGQSIQKLPLLLWQKDCKGDTPIHVLVRNAYTSRLLELCFKCYDKAGARGSVAGGMFSSPPWRLKNVDGDTPLHSAIRAQGSDSAMKLLEYDVELASYVNNRMETPLHLMAHMPEDDMFVPLVRRLIMGNDNLPYMQDIDGFTPLLTAVRENNTLMIQELYTQFPDCSAILDYKGKSLWHWFVSQNRVVNYYTTDDFNEMREICEFLIQSDFENHFIRRLMSGNDKDGNTPLHLAIKKGKFGFAKFFIDNWRDGGVVDTLVPEVKYFLLLSFENKERDSCLKLIGSAEHVPREFERDIFKNGNLLHGYRSMYGVPTTKIEAYANTIGVIAALLATITFTAAFTVPGGIDSNNGAPLLLQKAAFQVFLVADVVAMCSSMMVLFCLLWIITTSNKADSISLLDVSVFLLQTSFHATIVTFMTGLYVTTISIVPAIAISTLVASTLLIIIMHKTLVMVTVVPFFERLIIFADIVGRFMSSIKPKCPRST